jgi:diguanylate cyclase
MDDVPIRIWRGLVDDNRAGGRSMMHLPEFASFDTANQPSDDRMSELRFRALADATRDALIVVDDGTAEPGIGRRIVLWNRAAETLFGMDPNGLPKCKFEWVPQNDEAEPVTIREATISRRDGGRVRAEISASPWPSKTGRQVCYLIRCAGRSVARDRLAQTETRDELTGLRNRASFVECLDEALQSARSDGGAAPSVLYVDLDRFKAVNDHHGHAVGDVILGMAAERLVSQLRSTDIAARLGGDEFATLIVGVRTPEDLVGIADRCLAVLNVPYELDGKWCHMSASIGIATAHPGDDAEVVIQDADLAMEAAKRDGKARHQAYHPTLRAAAKLDLHIAELLRTVELNDVVSVHYQPIVSLESSALIGTEALLRWHEPLGSRVDPQTVVAIAERDGTMVALGRWIMARAVHDMKQWLDAELIDADTFVMAVNLSPAQLDDPQFARETRAVLEANFIAPRMLCVEIPEAALVDHYLDSLRPLVAMGIRLAVDDFGVGHSSLHSLVRYPATVTKIDRTLIAQAGSQRGAALLTAVVNLCHDLNLNPIAEGIETVEQLEFLRQLGMTTGQGYLFGRPMAADQLGQWLNERTTLAADLPRPVSIGPR